MRICSYDSFRPSTFNSSGTFLATIKPTLSIVAMRSRKLSGLPRVKNNAEERSSDYADVACASAWRLPANGAARPSATPPHSPLCFSRHAPITRPTRVLFACASTCTQICWMPRPASARSNAMTRALPLAGLYDARSNYRRHTFPMESTASRRGRGG